MARHRSSAAPLALLYVALIVYASLAPFTDWKQPSSVPAFGLLSLPWPGRWTGFDVISNLLGYMPVGALMFGALVRSGRGASASALAAVLTGALLSFVMENLQKYLPQRVPSSLDWMLNLGGTALGTLVAMGVHFLGGVQRWQALRDRWFIAESGGGIALLLLWPIGLLFPTPVPLGVGQVLGRLQELVQGALEGTPWESGAFDWFESSALQLDALSRGEELLTIGLGLLGPCLLVFSIVRPGWRRVVPVIAIALSGFATTTLSTTLNFGPQHALAWLTPPALPAFAGATLLALLLSRIPRRGAAALGLVAVTALVVLVAQAPADPYYADSLQGWEQGRFIRFHGAARWVGWLWPYAALVYLFTKVAARHED
jgi:VanZ family protein